MRLKNKNPEKNLTCLMNFRTSEQNRDIIHKTAEKEGISAGALVRYITEIFISLELFDTKFGPDDFAALQAVAKMQGKLTILEVLDLLSKKETVH